MSSGVHLILEVIPPGAGLARDLGGGEGVLRRSLRGAATAIPILTPTLKGPHLGFVEQPFERRCRLLDRLLIRSQKRPAGIAAAYRIVAGKRNEVKP